MIDGFAKKHLPLTEDIFKYISKIDFEQCNDYFYFKSGGDGDNGEILMDELDDYFQNAYKYRWHDLRKNPNDLPDKCDRTMYLVFGEYEERKKYFLSRFYGYGEECQGYREYPQGVWEVHSSGIDVIAWREIESFEEGDTDANN